MPPSRTPGRPQDFGFVIDFVIDWLMCLISPRKILDSILSGDRSERVRIRRALSLYVNSSLVLLAASGAYSLAEEPGEFLQGMGALVMFDMLQCVGSALSVYVSTKIFRIPIAFDRVLVTLTVFSAGYLPILQMLNAFIFLAVNDKVHGQGSLVLAFIAAPIVWVAWVVQVALALDVLAQQTTVERYRVFNAGACGLFINVIPTLVLSKVIN